MANWLTLLCIWWSMKGSSLTSRLLCLCFLYCLFWFNSLFVYAVLEGNFCFVPQIEYFRNYQRRRATRVCLRLPWRLDWEKSFAISRANVFHCPQLKDSIMVWGVKSSFELFRWMSSSPTAQIISHWLLLTGLMFARLYLSDE